MPAAAVVATEVGVKVGDFFVCSWGYDQTNIDFYKVVGVTASGKSVKVQKWSSAVAPDDFEGFSTSERVVPGAGPAMFNDWSDATPEMDYWERQAAVKSVPAPVKTKRLQSYSFSGQTESRVYFTVNDYSSAYKWDGASKSQTAFGFGH